MAQVTIKQLLEAGVHFGHQTRRWNPKMKRFIFGERNGIYIINLENTLACLEKAVTFIKQVAQDGREILWVGTKKQAKEPMKEAAIRCSMPYVNERWLGGMLTNFETVRKSINRLDAIDQMEQDGSFQFVTKKEVLSLKKEREKLDKNLAGVRKMRKLPGAVFVIDSKMEEIGVKEARKLGIPIVAILDTNCDPDMVTYPVPGNDDAIRAIKLFCELFAEAILEGKNQYEQVLAEEQARLATEAAEQAAAAEDAAKASGTEENAGEETLEEKLAEKFKIETEAEKEAKGKPRKTPRKESSRTNS
ncbi:MAG TPA: 30S ribosomal protein S2 [bacterium]|nr:30S ribosomal protein S2 [bacterium]